MQLQKISQDIYNMKYRLKDHNNNYVDNSIKDTFIRVAKTLASLEKSEEFYYNEFLWILENGAIPAGRIMSNCGAGKYKPNTSIINCTVSGNLMDDLNNIFERLQEAANTLKLGSGIGYNFSTLRPKGAFVSGVGADTSGPLSFADIYDKMCSIINSAGSRRGAQMMTFLVSHPDIMEVIKVKQEKGRLRKFNISIMLTDEFISAVKNKTNFNLWFPITHKELELFKPDDKELCWKNWPIENDRNYTYSKGKVLCRIYKSIDANELYNEIMKSTYNYAEPGVLFIDRINEMNNLHFCENIYATNPCGEQPLPPYGSCLLGSVNLTEFVENPFQDNVEFNFKKLKKVIAIFNRMLDNVCEINGLTVEKQSDEMLLKRRHGIGILGLGSMLCMMKIKYDSKEALELTEKIMQLITITSYKVGVELAKEKGKAPIFETEDYLEKYVKSKFIQSVLPSELIDEIKIHGIRYTHAISVAPTGSIALSFANNASNGIEPSFMHYYQRNVIVQGKNTKIQEDVYSYELLVYNMLINENIPDYFQTANSISPKAHIDMMCLVQKYVDSSISKTVNVPTEISFEEFKDLYLYAYDNGAKGCTTYRYNPDNQLGVLVNNEDLKNTKYKITLNDGTELVLSADKKINYDNDIHNVGNLCDSIIEGLYGKY